MGVVIFNSFAERQLNDILPGSTLTHAQVHDIHGLLSGSPAAQRGILHDAPALAGTLDRVVHSVSVAGFKAAGLFLALSSLIGVIIVGYDRWSRNPAAESAPAASTTRDHLISDIGSRSLSEV
jgi:hypothetical protein